MEELTGAVGAKITFALNLASRPMKVALFCGVAKYNSEYHNVLGCCGIRESGEKKAKL